MIPKFIQTQFEHYLKSNQNSPVKSDKGQERLISLVNKFYGVLYQDIVIRNKKYPTSMSIKYFEKITSIHKYIYFILNFFEQKNYIIPVRTENGYKSYSSGGKGTEYFFTDQFLNKIQNSEQIEDKQVEQFLNKEREQYFAEVDSQNERLLNEVFNQNVISKVKKSMNRLKELSFKCDQQNVDINYAKRKFRQNVVKFNYRIYSPLSSTKKLYRELGWVVDKEGNSIVELGDLHASGYQMLQFIMKKYIPESEAEIKWIEDLLNDKDGLYLAAGRMCGWTYGKKFMKNMLQWFINSDPAFKKEFIQKGICEGKNVVHNGILNLFYKHTPKLFNYLADYETYIDKGKTKSAIWKIIHRTETVLMNSLADKFEFKTYSVHDSLYCSIKDYEEGLFDQKWKEIKQGLLSTKQEIKVVESHQIFNMQEHITIEKIYDYYQNEYYMGKVQFNELSSKEKEIWLKINQLVFKPVWNNVDCGNILEGRKLEGENWMSRRDSAKEIINQTINKTIKVLQKIQTKYGNSIFKHILITIFKTQKEIIFFNKEM